MIDTKVGKQGNKNRIIKIHMNNKGDDTPNNIPVYNRYSDISDL